MANLYISPSKLSGSITVPSSKSHTMRALLFALMAKGKSTIHNPLASPDTLCMIQAITQLGAKVTQADNTLIIEGVAGKLQPAEDIIQCGNSGQVLRFIGALAALSPTYTILTGDPSIRHQRPVGQLLSALDQLGAFAQSSRQDGYAPILIKGPLTRTTAHLSGEDSQPISALLMLGAFTPLELHVTNPGEKPWVALTLSWFDRLAIPYTNHNFSHFIMKGNTSLNSFEYTVPADFSSAAFPIGASLTTQSTLHLNSIDLNDAQGDKAIISALTAMGAHFTYNNSTLTIHPPTSLNAAKLDINPFIDALPILAVIACHASGPITLFNGAIARHKESDRISCMAKELKKMGADIEERPDGLLIRPAKLHGSTDLDSHHDHRIAMALAVAALGATTESVIANISCIDKSYPTFVPTFQSIGAKMEIRDNAETQRRGDAKDFK